MYGNQVSRDQFHHLETSGFGTVPWACSEEVLWPPSAQREPREASGGRGGSRLRADSWEREPFWVPRLMGASRSALPRFFGLKVLAYFCDGHPDAAWPGWVTSAPRASVVRW